MNLNGLLLKEFILKIYLISNRELLTIKTRGMKTTNKLFGLIYLHIIIFFSVGFFGTYIYEYIDSIGSFSLARRMWYCVFCFVMMVISIIRICVICNNYDEQIKN